MTKPANHMFIGCLLFLCSLYAQADWGVNGIAAECAESGERFELLPIVELSSPGVGEVKLKPGFRRLDEGKNELSCQVGHHLVKASIRVYGPDGGACMGAGYVSIDGLIVGGIPIIEHPAAFNWDCPGEQIFVGLRITHQGSQSHVETCSAKSWGWDAGFEGVSCVSRALK